VCKCILEGALRGDLLDCRRNVGLVDDVHSLVTLPVQKLNAHRAMTIEHLVSQKTRSASCGTCLGDTDLNLFIAPVVQLDRSNAADVCAQRAMNARTPFAIEKERQRSK
jgi:hypothetical protein